MEVAQAAGIIALGNIASRALGLAREMVKSDIFGAGGDVSALNVALRIPTMMYDLLVGGIVSSALVPVLSDYAAPERRRELCHLLSVLVSVTLLALCGFVLVGELLAPQLVWLQAGGLSAPYRTLTSQLLRLVLPAVVFLSLASVLSGALYSLKRFTFPAFTAAAFNAATVAVALALGHRWGVRSMAVGMLVGAVLQVVLQAPAMRDLRLRFVLDLRHPALRNIGRLYVPILAGLAVDKLAELLSYNLASHISDPAISWMEYAAQIIQFPLGLVVTAVSVAILPTLSRQAIGEDSIPFRATLAQGLRLVLSLIIPATVGLYVLANPIIALVFEHGDFAPSDTVATVGALRGALLGLFFAAVDQPLIFAFYARKDTLTPAIVGVGTTVFYVLMALALWWLGALTLPLLVLVNSLKLTAHALAMLILGQRRLGGLDYHDLGPLTLKAILASLGMAGVSSSVARALTRVMPVELLGEVMVVVGAGGAGLVVYALLAAVLKIEEIRLLRSAAVHSLNRLTRLAGQSIIPRLGSREPQLRNMRNQPVCPLRYDESYFLSSCEGHEEFITSEGMQLSRRLLQAFEVAQIVPGMRVLDVGCGRGEILRWCVRLGAHACGVDYAEVAVRMARKSVTNDGDAKGAGRVYLADAKVLPLPAAQFHRVLMFDLVEHLQPWELSQSLAEARRVLRPDGKLIIHTAPNAWYDRYAYSFVRLGRALMGQGDAGHYPRDPRAIVPANLDVHVNEQSAVSLWRVLRRAGFRPRVWLDTPPQDRDEGWVFQVARHLLFRWPPFRWFFEREVFAVASVDTSR